MELVLYTELKYKRLNCFGTTFLSYTGVVNEENLPRVLEVEKPAEDDEKLEIDLEIKFELDIEFLINLDPKSWKDQDHYAVLGLQNGR